ncbi:MAG TPA: sulfotransferase, partial [Nitrospira sp.]|nr:sulfotransferase [Nitrospira sp.]
MVMNPPQRDDGQHCTHAAVASSDDVTLPNFLIVGAEKCGTTSLHHYLKQHPDIYLPVKKELHYFAYDHIKKTARDPGGQNVLTHACATREEYDSYYRATGSHIAIGEMSPSYFYFCNTSERIKSELGDPKIIIMLRDPVHKAYSQYMHLVRDNREHLSFFEALMAENQRIEAGWGPLWRYTESSLYSARVSKYLQVFGEDRVKIGLFDDLSRNPQTLVNDLFEYLGVAPHDSIDTSRAYNKS